MQDPRKARHRLKGFLLWLGFRYTGRSSWNDAHKRYLSGLVLPPPPPITFQECIHAIDDAGEWLDRLTQAVLDALPGWKWEPVVRALLCLRGVQELTGMTLVAEVGDFSRFNHPQSLMHFLGLTPSEHSSGGSRTQGGITKCGNAHCRRVLTEAAWQYRLHPKVSEAMRQRQQHQSQAVRRIARKAQQRLHKRLQQLAAKKKRVVAATAVARELAGFVWAMACQAKPAAKLAAPEIIRTCRGKVYRLDPNQKMEKAQ